MARVTVLRQFEKGTGRVDLDEVGLLAVDADLDGPMLLFLGVRQGRSPS